jgi:transposase
MVSLYAQGRPESAFLPYECEGAVSAMVPVLGVDIGKRTCHALLLLEAKRYRKSFTNDASGFHELDGFLRQRGIAQVHACMESSNSYAEALALHLHQAGHVVSVVNPARIKAYAQSELVRTKTDAVDAGVIARFCQAQRPEPWTPVPPELRTLQLLLRRRENLVAMHTEELNRAHGEAGLPAIVQTSIAHNIAHLKQEIAALERAIAEHLEQHPDLKRRHELLTSIPAIGDLTADRILGEIPGISEFRNAKAVVAYAGLSPRHGRSRLSKTGNAALRARRSPSRP